MFDADRFDVDECDFEVLPSEAYRAPISESASCGAYRAKQPGRRPASLADTAGVCEVQWPALIPVLALRR